MIWDYYKKKENLRTIRHLSDELCNEIKNIHILPAAKKLPKTKGRPVVPFLLEKYLTVYSLRLKNGMSVENAS